jgi:hypothetical protein
MEKTISSYSQFRTKFSVFVSAQKGLCVFSEYIFINIRYVLCMVAPKHTPRSSQSGHIFYVPEAYTVKKNIVFPSPDVTNQTLPGRE